MNDTYIEICLCYIYDAIERATGRDLASLVVQRAWLEMQLTEVPR